MKHIMNLIRNSAIYIAIVNVVEIYRAATHRHDWVYSSQVEELGIHIGTKQPIKQIFKTRYCNKCGVKEKNTQTGLGIRANSTMKNKETKN